MANTFTLAGTFQDGETNALFAGKYVIFRITSIGTDMEDNAAFPRNSVDFLIDANGDFGGTLWINGDSGTECFYEIKTPDGQRIDVVIPSSVEATTVRFEDIIELYQVDTTTQQSTVLSTALAYTDTLAADPSDNASFNAATWLVDLGINPASDNQFLVSTGANTWALESGATAQISLGIQTATGGGKVGTGFTTTGGSVGHDAISTTGFAGGEDSTCTTGSAVGDLSAAIDGFAGGFNARAALAGAAQICTGTNTTVNTFQFRDSGSITATQIGKLAATTTSVTTTTYTTLATDRTILATNASGVTVTLLAAATAGDGFRLCIKNVGSAGTITVDANLSETIDGVTTQILTSQYKVINIESDGSNWHIIT